MTTATPITTTTRAAKLRRAAVVSAAVLALGAFAGCGGNDDSDNHKAGSDRPAPAAIDEPDAPPSFTADPEPDTTSDSATGDWESQNEYASEAKQSFMESCETSSGGETSACQCLLDELEQTMSFDEFLETSLDVVKGEDPPQKFYDAAEACTPGAGGGGSLNLN